MLASRGRYPPRASYAARVPTNDSCTVRLRSVAGKSLADPAIRGAVIAAARALAERENVPLRSVDADASSLTVTLGVDRLAGLGFLSELRSSTNAWYEAKFGVGPLWPTQVGHDDD